MSNKVWHYLMKLESVFPCIEYLDGYLITDSDTTSLVKGMHMVIS